MTTFYLRLALLPIILLTAVLLLIRSQPYDDHELRELLLPADCPAPCFMGIQPGVTTVDEAVKLLEASEWVKRYVLEPFEYRPSSGGIRVEWNDKSPIWLEKDIFGRSIVSIIDNLVSSFQLDTKLPIGTIQLILGQSTYNSINYNSGYLVFSAMYPDQGLGINTYQNCQEQSKGITYDRKIFLFYNQFETRPDPIDYKSWADVIRTKCPLN